MAREIQKILEEAGQPVPPELRNYAMTSGGGGGGERCAGACCAALGWGGLAGGDGAVQLFSCSPAVD